MKKRLIAALAITLIAAFGLTLRQDSTARAQGIVTVTPSATLPLSASATSPLMAFTPIIGETPLATAQSVLPGTAPGVALILPTGWRYGYFTRLSSDLLVQGQINLAIFTGPIRGGTGTIITLWNYPSISPIQTAGAAIAPTPGGITPVESALWADGLRLLQGTVVDITCNVGHYGQRRDLTVGKLAAIGESFTASQCSGEPDTVGWFAGVRQFEVDYLFYVYTEPAESFNDLKTDLQTILDSATFKPLAVATPVGTLPAPAPNSTPVNTPALTPTP